MWLLPLLACGGVASEADAELAYHGLDRAVERALALGLQGFGEASSANIPQQQGDGDAHGTMVVTGQVDQGASTNKGLRLDVALTEYSDTLGDDGEPDLVYDTDTPASLDLQLKDIPDGTLSGTFAGTFLMDGALVGVVELSLAMQGDIEADGDGVRRVDGTTEVTGTATSDYGVYEVDLVR